MGLGLHLTLSSGWVTQKGWYNPPFKKKTINTFRPWWVECLIDLSPMCHFGAWGLRMQGILLVCLAEWGLGDLVWDWFCSFISDRFQKVAVLGGCGSALWPLEFHLSCHAVYYLHESDEWGHQGVEGCDVMTLQYATTPALSIPLDLKKAMDTPNQSFPSNSS